MSIEIILVDARNFDQLIDRIVGEMQAATLVGFDIETFDDAHPGIVRQRKGTKVIFDPRRTTVAGFSVYPKDGKNAYYVNLNHADAENRVPWSKARRILDAKPANTPWVVHNNMFERTMMKASLNFDVGDEIIDTMQLAVSAFGPDEYDIEDFGKINSWEFSNLIPGVLKEFAGFDRNIYEMTAAQAKLFGQVVGKESDAAHSYNGFTKSIAYGYGLKQLVRNFLKQDIGDFKALLAKYGANDMRDLTGEQVADYGGNDAYYVMPIFQKIISMMRPESIEAFEKQENCMVAVYSDIWLEGCKIDTAAVDRRRLEEEAAEIQVMEELKEVCQSMLPFPNEPNMKLFEKEDWYRKNDAYLRYRKRFEMWKKEGAKKGDHFNVTHYMMARVMFYDLAGLKPVIEKGKVQSDGEARGKLIEKAEGPAKKMLQLMNQLAGIEQRIKLYLKPYQDMVDPDTGRVYPQVSSMLATRRMAGSNPNTMQLAKQGESTYIRGFYLPDGPDDMNDYRRKVAAPYMEQYSCSAEEGWQRAMKDFPNEDYRHGIFSLDLSQIELVLIGEMSGDPAFAEAYGQLPYKDLHVTAAASILASLSNRPDFTRDDFIALKMGENRKNLELIDAKGNTLDPKAAYKYNRGNAGGKGANFEFWYSGYLATTAERRGLSNEETSRLVEAYQDVFPVAVGWRQDQKLEAMQTGRLSLPDGHDRVKFEATAAWQAMMRTYIRQMCQSLNEDEAKTLMKFGDLIISKISKRAVNQLINAKIQGSCAAIIKRSIWSIRKIIVEYDCRFMFPVHDEAVFSCRLDHMLPAINRFKPIMCDHPTIIKNLVMDSSPSIGLSFEPYHPKKNPYGQIELNEAPDDLPFIPESMRGGKMDDETILKTVEYLKNAA